MSERVPSRLEVPIVIMVPMRRHGEKALHFASTDQGILVVDPDTLIAHKVMNIDWPLLNGFGHRWNADGTYDYMMLVFEHGMFSFDGTLFVRREPEWLKEGIHAASD